MICPNCNVKWGTSATCPYCTDDDGNPTPVGHPFMVESVLMVGMGLHFPMSREAVDMVLNLPIGDEDDGRSEWRWFRLNNGDLICGFFPQAGGYERCEVPCQEDYELVFRSEGGVSVLLGDVRDMQP